MSDKLYSDFLYVDQSYTELYDSYDIKHMEVPRMVSEAEILKEGKSSRVVKIDYYVPENDSIWNLDGNIGKAPAYEEAGKKAFVHGGKYIHPEKGWYSEIVYMEPYEYVERCHKFFASMGGKLTLDEMVDLKLRDYDLEEVFTPVTGHIFYPVIDYYNYGQEGLHRALWALYTYGDDPIPVIIINKK